MSIATASRPEALISVAQGSELEPCAQSATWDKWNDPAPRRGDTDTETALQARKQRAQARLAFPAMWQAYLAGLPHYDVGFAYDELHEYHDDWSSDPDYRGHVAHVFGFDEDGFVMPDATWHNRFIAWLLDTLRDALGYRVVREPEFHFPAEIGERLELTTKSGKVKEMVVPDLLVLIDALDEEREHRVDERTLYVDVDTPTPALAVEIVSPTSDNHDFANKFRLYEALGINEYLLVDTGELGKPGEPDRPANMILYRLDGEGRYQQVEGNPDWFSICDIPVRLQPGDIKNPPYLQWWDETGSLWRDARSDEKQAQIQEGEIRTLLQALDVRFPNLSHTLRSRVESSWREAGVPDDMLVRIMDGTEHPSEWQDVLPHTDSDVDGNGRRAGPTGML